MPQSEAGDPGVVSSDLLLRTGRRCPSSLEGSGTCSFCGEIASTRSSSSFQVFMLLLLLLLLMSLS